MSSRGHNLQLCPLCRHNGKPVSTITVKSLVRNHSQVPASTSYSFCSNPGCDAVYFSDGVMFTRKDVKVRVGIKETEDPVPLCYCFDYTRHDIRQDLATKGRSEIPEKIKAEVQAGFCACEVKNPAGNCCLGDVLQAVKEIAAEGTTPSPG